MDEKKFLNLNGLSSFLTNLKKIFATAAQGTKADSAYTHAQSAHAPSNAERNIVVGIQKNGSDLTPNSSSRKVNITVPTKVSELTNDSGYKTTDTTYENATTSTDGLMSSEDKTKLDGVATGANKYVHPSYTSKASGLYKVTVDSTGHVSATSAVVKSDITALGIPGSDTNTWTAFKGATSSAVGIAGYVPAPAAGASNRYFRSDGTWAVPPDTNTTYSNMTAATSSVAGKSGLVPAPAAGAQTKYLRGDGTWQTPPNTTYGVATGSSNGLMAAADKTKLDGIATGANKYTHPSYTAKSSGLYKVTVDATGHVSAATAVTKSDITGLGIPSSDTNTWIALKGATTSAAGTAGYVPAPAAGAANRYLRSDGTWTVPPDTNTTYSVATTSANGLMSSADKSKLDGIAAGANKYTLPTASSSTLGGVKTTSAVTSTSGLTPCPIISGVPYYKDTNTTYSLSSFGITATAAELNKLDGCTATVGELNYVHGVTSAIQTQLNAKAASNHTHSGYAASSHNHSAANITSGTLPVARGGTGGTTAATARTGIGAINTVCQTTEPTTQNTGDFWFREV